MLFNNNDKQLSGVYSYSIIIITLFNINNTTNNKNADLKNSNE